jgi:lysyl-tRNA synthetase class 2
LVFYDLYSEGYKIQVRANRREWVSNNSTDSDNNSDQFAIHRHINRGDIICVKGTVRRTPRGELSIYAISLTPLTPCLNDIPMNLKDTNIRLRQRYLDLLIRPDRLQVFAQRSRIINSLRSFLVNNRFLEVETPILWPSVGGAIARPFVTSSNAFGENLPLYLRIAPELFLKELILSGYERIFELSKVFRNEGIDDSHNPEFTSCEFYWAYADFQQLISFTQEMIIHIVKSVNNDSPIMQVRSFIPLNDNVSSKSSATEPAELHEQDIDIGNPLITIDFSQPFRVVDVLKELESIIGIPFVDPNDDANLPFYINLVKQYQLEAEVSLPCTIPRILDKFIGIFIEPTCIQPTFITRHPICMSPLARSSLQPHYSQHNSASSNPIDVCDRFELFIGGKEIVNAYSELSDPEEQRRRFASQQRQHEEFGDDEAMLPDEHYCKALEYGLPPTSGWGMGIDRFCMLLTQSTHIRDVMYFPIMKPQGTSSPSTDSAATISETVSN